MSYDLTFLIKEAWQSWEEALEALEDAEPDGLPDSQVWAGVLHHARAVLGEVSEHRDDDYYELDHEPTGIQLTLFTGEAGITVPYWYKGEDARRIVRTIYQLGRIVEEQTGLSGYDGQVELPLAEAVNRPDLASAVFDQVAASFARRGISSPSNDDQS
ncbi:ERO1 family protein [Actinoplanes bogorensis]|uniref:ERO1 family protein n=1 Tax=Paractinoplanes bogorensis TaxID=1610840 RepID=A0ABS5YJV6_9ACTN|nr:ERO1 family protein [Actinoplanes bogorensis]MBU2663755.1 ERO1 family protein [Actinoplanes bogorensis]